MFLGLICIEYFVVRNDSNEIYSFQKTMTKFYHLFRVLKNSCMIKQLQPKRKTLYQRS